MKTVVLVRHAKSSWSDSTVSDFDRTLNARGKKNAPDMAERLLKQGIQFDSLLSSPAIRAKRTAEIFAETLGISSDKLMFIPELYNAYGDTFTQVISNAPETSSTIAIFAHNPGITDYVNSLTNIRIDNMPTAAIFGVSANIGHWKEFEESVKEFLFFDFPKSTH